MSSSHRSPNPIKTESIQERYRRACVAASRTDLKARPRIKVCQRRRGARDRAPKFLELHIGDFIDNLHTDRGALIDESLRDFAFRSSACSECTNTVVSTNTPTLSVIKLIAVKTKIMSRDAMPSKKTSCALLTRLADARLIVPLASGIRRKLVEHGHNHSPGIDWRRGIKPNQSPVLQNGFKAIQHVVSQRLSAVLVNWHKRRPLLATNQPRANESKANRSRHRGVTANLFAHAPQKFAPQSEFTFRRIAAASRNCAPFGIVMPLSSALSGMPSIRRVSISPSTVPTGLGELLPTTS